jgi:hypothetical protein
VAFDRNWLSVYQVIGGKCTADGRLVRPWTRLHQYLPSDFCPVAEPSDWKNPD